MSNPINSKFFRRKKLIKKGLQLRLTASFIGVSLLAFFLHSLLITSYLTNAAAELPSGGAFLMDLLPGILVRSLVFSLGVLLPLVTVVGILSTFKIAGPLYRFEDHLKRLGRGERVVPCKLRKGDELTEMCEVIDNVAIRMGALEEPGKSGELEEHSAAA